VNLGDNFSDSFEYTKKLLKDAGRLIILIVLSIIPIVEWIVLGYMARVVKESPGSGTPPKLENYGQLFVDGAKIFFASLVYLLVPTILIIVGAWGTFAGFQSSMAAPAILVGGTGLIFLLIGVILAILLSIILGVGLAHMIKTGKFGNAFAFGEIFGIIRGIGWVKYLGWIVITAIISIVLVAITNAIPLAGWIITAIVHPFVYIFIFRSLGLLYNDGAPAGLKVQAPVVMSTGLTCASCGTPLQPEQKFCPNCGAAAPSPPPPPQTPTGTKFCISCGAKIPSTAVFCGSCGAKQT
jgi:predicted RNA-binding Zn-ribbon protein involved in translation (DUF1610 family)